MRAGGGPGAPLLAGSRMRCRRRTEACALKCEIEFLAVGDGTKAGDAVIIRYGKLTLIS